MAAVIIFAFYLFILLGIVVMAYGNDLSGKLDRVIELLDEQNDLISNANDDNE